MVVVQYSCRVSLRPLMYKRSSRMCSKLFYRTWCSLVLSLHFILLGEHAAGLMRSEADRNTISCIPSSWLLSPSCRFSSHFGKIRNLLCLARRSRECYVTLGLNGSGETTHWDYSVTHMAPSRRSNRNDYQGHNQEGVKNGWVREK